MSYMYLVLLIVLSVLGFVIGRSEFLYRIRNRPGIIILRVVLLVIICSWGFFRYFPELEFYLIPDWFALPFEIIWFTPFAIFFFSNATKLIARRVVMQYLLIILVVLLFLFGLNHASWVISDLEIDSAKFTIDENGVCLQSTGFTCGPATAVTLLHYWGISTTEREMTRVVHCSRDGTRMVSLARGIRQKIKNKGFKVNIQRLNWEEMMNIDHPCILCIKFGLLVDHVVVVLEVHDDHVLIGDPLKGRLVWSKEKFLQEWRNVVITMQPAG